MPGGDGPPVFFDLPTAPDLRLCEALAKGARFDSGVILGVADRCPSGAPRVLICRPMYRMKPFPTTFWLICPHLARICDELESRGGVGEVEKILETRRDEWNAYQQVHRSIRLALVPGTLGMFLRRYEKSLWRGVRKGGIGGMVYGDGPRVKCLHLQTASWLALGRHPASGWLKKHIGEAGCPPGSTFPCASAP